MKVYIFLYIRLFAKHIAMKFKGLFLFVFIFSFNNIFSQDLSLSILTIPDSLTKNANSVIRFDETNVELVSHKKMIIRIKKVTTVLNKLGDHESKIRVFYDKNTRIKSLKVISYNSNGKEIKKTTKSKFIDLAAVDGISLYNDGRLKYFSHVPTSYPYTIYQEYQIETSNTASIPPWLPINSYNQSVQKSTFKITFPQEITLQKKERLFNQFKIESNQENNTISYSLNETKAVKKEDYSPSFAKLFPSVKIITNKFSIEGLDGKANDWIELGKWQYDNFYTNIGELPNSTKNEIKQLVTGVVDNVEKAKIVYKYVQDKTRYISVQVGIGGLKPMLVQDVDKLGYGDCKALTNYTKSLLEAVNVKSYFTELYGNREKLNMDYNSPYIQGNHVILNVPNGSEDIWLECTSQKVPFGYIANFTDDRDVIVIKPEGGFLKHTTVYKDKSNLQLTEASYSIDSKGKMFGKVEIQSKGTQYGHHFEIESKPKKEIDKYYKNNYLRHINNLNINEAVFSNDKLNIVFKENLDLSATDYVSFSENRMLFIPNAFNRNTNIPKRYRNRKFDMEISRGYIDKDEYIINTPSEYSIETIPKKVKVENKFGEYIFSVEKIAPNQLKYTRELFIKKGRYSKEDYVLYRKFKKLIAKHDKTKIILIKN